MPLAERLGWLQDALAIGLPENPAVRPNQQTTKPDRTMKRIISTIAALAFSAAFVTAADEPKKPAADAPKPDAPAGEKKKHDPAEAWKKIAGDKESVTLEEFIANAKDKAKAEATFKAKDKNNDGKLTKEEFMAHGKKK